MDGHASTTSIKGVTIQTSQTIQTANVQIKQPSSLKTFSLDVPTSDIRTTLADIGVRMTDNSKRMSDVDFP